MGFLLFLFLILISWLLGKGVLFILYGRHPEKEFSEGDTALSGAMLFMGLAETAHLGTLFFRRSFSDCVLFFCGLLGLCAAASLAIVFLLYQKDGKSAVFSAWAEESQKKQPASAKETYRKKRHTKGETATYLVFALLALSQVLYLTVLKDVYRQGDMTVETVNSFLESNVIYQVNPLTGQVYEAGMPLRLRILGLPTLYGILCRISGLSAVQVVWELVPVLTLLGAYCAFFGLSKRLFPDSCLKRGLFLVFVALIFWVGDYMYGVDGFGVLHSGFQGTVIRAVVLLPFVFDLCIRKNWRLAALCILAEACLVWTLYGMGACLFAAAGMFLLQRWLERKPAAGGKEASE